MSAAFSFTDELFYGNPDDPCGWMKDFKEIYMSVKERVECGETSKELDGLYDELIACLNYHEEATFNIKTPRDTITIHRMRYLELITRFPALYVRQGVDHIRYICMIYRDLKELDNLDSQHSMYLEKIAKTGLVM